MSSKTRPHLIKTFNGGYGRVGEIKIIHGKCTVCDKETKCLYIDGSEGEYAGGAICQECTETEFKR